jgi:hypothetical protein
MIALMTLALCCSLLVPTTASADLADDFKGSSVSVNNVVSSLSLQKDGQLTYNPYYAVSVQAAPRYWFSELFYTSLTLGAAREITNSDITTQKGETNLNDITLRLGLSKIASIPGGITLSGSLDTLIPTSKASRARTMIVGLRPALNISWSVPGLESLSVNYSGSGSWYAHEYTTASREVPLILGCAITDGGCDAFSHNGVRNTQWRLINSISTNFSATSWLGFSATFVMLHDFVYPLEADEEQATSFVPQKPSSTRYVLAYDLSMNIKAMSSMNIALGASTANPQLAPDTSHYAPFYNRYTNFYLNLSLDLPSIFASSPDR